MTTPVHIEALTHIVLNNLENQQDWTALESHTKPNLSRQLITGLPPRRIYVHPDEQIEIIKAEKAQNGRIPQPPEYEWVLPVHITEKWNLKAFAEVFDAIETIPPGVPVTDLEDGDRGTQWKQWRGLKRGKRILLATVQDDSTVVYYLMHDGIVKPRQN